MVSFPRRVTLWIFQAPESPVNKVTPTDRITMRTPAGVPDGARALCELSFKRLPPGTVSRYISGGRPAPAPARGL